MSAFQDGINTAVARTFSRPDPVRVVRHTLITAAYTALLAWAAHSLDGTLALALWAWVALRLSAYLLMPLGRMQIDEKMRRLEALPPEYLRFLRTGKP